MPSSRPRFHYAAARGHAAAVASLCALGADVAARDERDCVPLHYCAGGGKWDAARALLVRGADPNAPDKDERTPLHYAARRGCPKTTGLLVNGGWGTRLDATSARGTTALSEAVEHKRAAAAEVLAAAGAAVGAEDGDGLARLLNGDTGDGATRAGDRGGRRGDRVGRRGDRDARAGTPAGRFDQTPLVAAAGTLAAAGVGHPGSRRRLSLPRRCRPRGLHLRRRCTARRAAGRPARATSRGTGVGRVAAAG